MKMYWQPGRKGLQGSINFQWANHIILCIIEVLKHAKKKKQKSQLPSPPCVRPHITQSQTAASNSVKTTEREGSPTMESMRQALQAQTAPSGQVVKTIRVFLLLILTNSVGIILLFWQSTVYLSSVQCIRQPTSHLLNLLLMRTHLTPLEIVLVCWHWHWCTMQRQNQSTGHSNKLFLAMSITQLFGALPQSLSSNAFIHQHQLVLRCFMINTLSLKNLWLSSTVFAGHLPWWG